MSEWETCRTCNYRLVDTGNNQRCLLAEGFIGIEKMKDGLIGKCEDHKPITNDTGG